MDLFDRVRRAIQDMNRPVMAGVLWMLSWDSSVDGVIQNKGGDALGGHCVKLAGFTKKKRDGSFINPMTQEVYICAQNSWGETAPGSDGGLYYFPRAVFNKVFGNYGIGYWSDDPNQKIQKLGLISALLVNVLNLFTKLLHNTGTYPPPFSPKLIQWANAIASCEGGNVKFNNPGNMKLSSLTASWGAQAGFQAKDGGWIAKFPTYQQGFTALCNFLKLGAENQLIAFHQARTLAQFTKIYAGNPPPTYLQKVCHMTGATPETDIATFL